MCDCEERTVEYLIYRNDNGTDKLRILPGHSAEEVYRNLLEAYEDDYLFTVAFYVSVYEGYIDDVYEVFIPELEEPL
jgi:hypothetical protein